MSVRTLTIATRIDTAGFDAGIKHQISEQEQYAAQIERINAQLAAAESRAASKSIKAAMNPAATDYAKEAARANNQYIAAQAEAEKKLSAIKHAQAQADKQVQIDLERTIYAATHTSLETQLRDRQRYYAQLREAHAANAQTLLLIDRAETAERNQLLSAGAAPGGHGKRLAKEELKYAAGTAMGMAGGELGMLASAALMGGTTVAAIAAPLVAVGLAYKTMHDGAMALADQQERHAKAARESAHWMEELGAAQTTASGQQYRSRAHELTEQARDMEAQAKKRTRELGLWDTAGLGLDALVHGGMENTGFGKFEMEEVAEAKRKQQEARHLRMYAAQEEVVARENREAESAAAVGVARTGAMYEGPEKREASFKNRQAAEQRKFEEDWRQRLADADRAAQMAEPGKAKREAEEKQDALAEEHERAKKNFEDQQGWDKLAHERAEAERRRRMNDRTDELQATAGKLGYARQEAALEARYKPQLEEAQRGGDKYAEASLNAQKHAEQKDMAAQRDEAMRQKQVQGQVALAEATRNYAEADALARTEEERRLTVAGATAAQLKALMGDYDKLLVAQRAEATRREDVDLTMRLATAMRQYAYAASLAREEEEKRYLAATKDQAGLAEHMKQYDLVQQLQANRPLEDSLRESNRQLDILNGKMSQLEATRKRMQEQNPLADPKLIEQAAQAAEKVRLQSKYESPLRKFEREQADIKEAERLKLLSPDRARLEQIRGLQAMLGGQGEAGRFVSSENSWRDMQSNLSQTGNLPELTLKETQSVRGLLAELLAEQRRGLKLRTAG